MQLKNIIKNVIWKKLIIKIKVKIQNYYTILYYYLYYIILYYYYTIPEIKELLLGSNGL